MSTVESSCLDDTIFFCFDLGNCNVSEISFGLRLFVFWQKTLNEIKMKNRMRKESLSRIFLISPFQSADKEQKLWRDDNRTFCTVFGS
jgi:hypothetical protein